MNKWMIGILCGVIGAGLGLGVAVGIKTNYLAQTLEKKSEQADKYNELFQLMNQWVRLKQKGKTLIEYFEEKGYRQIAIYGMNFAGETLVNELEDSSVCVKYGIDKDAKHIMASCNMITPDEVFEEVDAIVVTPVYYYSQIADLIEKRVSCPVISLEDII